MGRPVFDYSVGTPWIITDDMEARVADDIDRLGHRQAADRLQEEMIRRIRSDPHYRDRLKAAYEEAGVNLCSVTLIGRDSSIDYAEHLRRDLLRWNARFHHLEWLTLVTGPTSARETADSGEVGIVLNTQHLGAAIGDDLDEIDRLYNGGLRIAQLTYNSQNRLGTGCTDRSDGGLSNFGLAAVERLNRREMIIDLSHCGHRTTLDAIDRSTDPVAVTHASCASVADHDRAKSDEVLERLAETDGYFGVVGVPAFLDPSGMDGSFDAFFNHLDHAISVVGPDRVGIGTDFRALDTDYPDALVPGVEAMLADAGFREEHGVDVANGFGEMRRYADFHRLKSAIDDRYDNELADGILSENFLAFWERVAG